MSYDESLAARCRAALQRESGITERKMFGGLAFMLEGNMICGVIEKKLVVRLDKGDGYENALKEKHVKPMDFTGRPLCGFVYVLPAGTADSSSLKLWLHKALGFGKTLKPKAAASRKRAKKS